MRVLLDTHIFIWYAKEQDKLSKDVLAILSDYENEVYVSSETLISADGKFPFYRNQGLDLVENK